MIKNVFGSKKTSAYDAIESLCLKYLPAEDRKLLESDQKRFHEAFQSLNEQIKGFQEDIGQITLASFITEWARSLRTDAVHGERYMRHMCELIESGILQLITDKKSPYTASTFGSGDHIKVIETIRCHVDWSIEKREDMVCFYSEFALWLAEMTFGFIPLVEDPDRLFSARRTFPFEAYIQLISELDLRERILAKLCYLGRERTQDEILSLDIANIDFAKRSIAFAKQKILYPAHVFQDLQEYIQGRTKGYVFVGRKGEKINHTVPYRSLKVAVDKIGLDPTFTFKDLIKES